MPEQETPTGAVPPPSAAAPTAAPPAPEEASAPLVPIATSAEEIAGHEFYPCFGEVVSLSPDETRLCVSLDGSPIPGLLALRINADLPDWMRAVGVLFAGRATMANLHSATVRIGGFRYVEPVEPSEFLPWLHATATRVQDVGF